MWPLTQRNSPPCSQHGAERCVQAEQGAESKEHPDRGAQRQGHHDGDVGQNPDRDDGNGNAALAVVVNQTANDRAGNGRGERHDR